jgi:hypothetical protein
VHHTEDHNGYLSDDCSHHISPSDTPKEFGRYPDRATGDSRDSTGITNYSIAFASRKIPRRESGFDIHRTRAADMGTDEFSSLNDVIRSPIPESDSIPAPVSSIYDRDWKDDACDYPLGVEDDDELYLEEPGTWDAFDNQIFLDVDHHWAEVGSRESGSDEGLPPVGTSIGQYFDAGDIYDQEDIQVSVREETEEEYDVRNGLVDITDEEFRPRASKRLEFPRPESAPGVLTAPSPLYTPAMAWDIRGAPMDCKSGMPWSLLNADIRVPVASSTMELNT